LTQFKLSLLEPCATISDGKRSARQHLRAEDINIGANKQGKKGGRMGGGKG